LFFFTTPNPPNPPLFPYTTLFRSSHKNRTGDNGGRCHLFVKAPRPKGANVVDVLLVSRSTRFSGPGAFPRRLHVTRKTSSTERRDRKSTRLNSSHVAMSYAVFCLK